MLWKLAFMVAVPLALAVSSSLGWAQTPEVTWDFETGDLRGWRATGTAFSFQPTRGDNASARDRGQPSGHQGDFWVGTFERYQGRRGEEPGAIQTDRPQGTLSSGSFVVTEPFLSFLVGGGSSFETRVELLVVTDPVEPSIRVRYASGQDSETMRRVTWDVREHEGREAYIRIVDASSGPWGHINADDFRFTSRGVEGPGRDPDLGGVPVPREEVPELIGRTLPQAEEILTQYPFALGGVERTADVPPEVEPGTIVDQRPPPGEVARAGTQIDVLVAAGVLRVPELRGAPVEAVRELLAERRLVPGAVSGRPGFEPAGTVIDQDPPPGAPARPGDEVSVVVVEPQLVEVRDVRGEPVERAFALLERTGLGARRARVEPSDAPPGTVIDQDPPPGEDVPLGTTVDLVIAEEPAPDPGDRPPDQDSVPSAPSDTTGRDVDTPGVDTTRAETPPFTPPDQLPPPDDDDGDRGLPLWPMGLGGGAVLLALALGLRRRRLRRLRQKQTEAPRIEVHIERQRAEARAAYERDPLAWEMSLKPRVDAASASVRTREPAIEREEESQ